LKNKIGKLGATWGWSGGLNPGPDKIPKKFKSNMNYLSLVNVRVVKKVTCWISIPAA